MPRAAVNEASTRPQEPKYLRGYVGLRSHGRVNNFVWLEPKRTKSVVHIGFRISTAGEWNDRFEEAGLRVHSHRKRRVRVTVTVEEFGEHRDLIRTAIVDTIREHGA